MTADLQTAPIPLTAVTAAFATTLARRGWRIFPCVPGGKRPAVTEWEQRASSDPELVAASWRGPCAGYNTGIACGPSGLVVVDLDTHGTLPVDWRRPGIIDDRDVMAQLCEWAGQEFPVTYMVATPSGGWHLYFTAPAGPAIRNSTGKLGPLVDVRGQGGYVVGPGSVVDGRCYEVLSTAGAAPLPRWLQRLLMPQPPVQQPAAEPSGAAAPGRIAGLVRTVTEAAEGQRNSTLHWAACRAAEMTAAGEIGAEDVTAALMAAAAAAGLVEREAARTITSGMRGGAR